MMQKTVAEILVETLVAAGVTRIYGVVGDSLNGVLDGAITDVLRMVTFCASKQTLDVFPRRTFR